MNRLVFFLVLALFIFANILNQMEAEAGDTASIPHLSASEWKEDLLFFKAQVEQHHRDPFNRVSKQELDAEFQRVIARLGKMGDVDVVLELQALAAIIGDGHTFVSTDRYRSFPLRVFWYGDDLRVTAASADLRKILGTRLVAINGIPVNEASERLNRIIPQGESRWYRLDASATIISQVEPLVALKIVRPDGSGMWTFLHDDGREERIRVAPSSKPLLSAFSTTPLHLQNPDQPLWVTLLPDQVTGYVSFRSYKDLDATSERLKELIQREQLQRLIVDLRHNRGGNYTHGRKFIIELIQFSPAINRTGSLYVVTGRHTFSAAMTNATDFRRETEAILVGEPTAAKPYGYQENYFFELPNSRLSVSVAQLHYRFGSPDEEAVFPDKRIEPNWRMDHEGDDAVLHWILSQPLRQ
jgi:hypothetical protein